jgi:hypothetical protein
MASAFFGSTFKPAGDGLITRRPKGLKSLNPKFPLNLGLSLLPFSHYRLPDHGQQGKTGLPWVARIREDPLDAVSPETGHLLQKTPYSVRLKDGWKLPGTS